MVLSLSLPQIVSQHAEEASFLWLLRSQAVYAPHYNLDDLARLDGRLDAHLDGLRIAGADAWSLIDEYLAREEPGEVFMAAYLAFDADVNERIRHAVTVGCSNPETFPAVVSALGWHPYEKIAVWIERFLSSPRQKLRHLAIAACAVHRHDPGPALDRAVADDYPPLRARALRAVGELKRRDLTAALLANLGNSDHACRFWAAWSATLLGERRALPVLQTFAETDSGFRYRALQVALRVMELGQARAWLNTLSARPDFARSLVQSVGILGDPEAVPWLIEQMKVPELARVTGEAFTSITGVDLAYQDLERDQPEGFEAGPSESPADEDVALDPDENLPWPDPELVAELWATHGGQYMNGNRYLLGRIISEESAREALIYGNQRQRWAGAMELVLSLVNEFVFEVRGSGIQQKIRISL